MKIRRVMVVAALFLAFGCGDDEPDLDVDGEPADGTVEGNDWFFISGNAIPQDDSDYYDINLADQSIDPCEQPYDDGFYIQMAVLPEESEQSTFVAFTEIDGMSGGVTASTGPVEITEWGDDLVQGYIDYEHDEENAVEGSFAAQICDE